MAESFSFICDWEKVCQGWSHLHWGISNFCILLKASVIPMKVTDAEAFVETGGSGNPLHWYTNSFGAGPWETVHIWSLQVWPSCHVLAKALCCPLTVGHQGEEKRGEVAAGWPKGGITISMSIFFFFKASSSWKLSYKKALGICKFMSKEALHYE